MMLLIKEGRGVYGLLYLKAPSLQTVAIKHEKLLLNTSKRKEKEEKQKGGRRGRRGKRPLATRCRPFHKVWLRLRVGEVFLRRGH